MGCMNGATCVTDSSYLNFECTGCPEDYHGSKCNAKKPCVDNPCKNGAECSNIPIKTYEEPTVQSDWYSLYTCHCEPGFTGKDCQTEIACDWRDPVTGFGHCGDPANVMFCTNSRDYTTAECVCMWGWTGAKC